MNRRQSSVPRYVFALAQTTSDGSLKGTRGGGKPNIFRWNPRSQGKKKEGNTQLVLTPWALYDHDALLITSFGKLVSRACAALWHRACKRDRQTWLFRLECDLLLFSRSWRGGRNARRWSAIAVCLPRRGRRREGSAPRPKRWPHSQ